MSTQRGERAIFLFLFCLVLAVVGWFLISIQEPENSQAEDTAADTMSNVVSEGGNSSVVKPLVLSDAEKRIAEKKAAEDALAKEKKAKEAAEKQNEAALARLKSQRAKAESIPVYAARLADAKAFTSFTSRSELLVVEPGAEWSKILSVKGFPVWISAPLVEKVGNSHVRVTANSANLRSLPTLQGSRVLGRARAGDIMKINRKQGDWLRVWSPVRISAWAKSAQVVPKAQAVPEAVPQNAASSLVETAM